jgi:hypothetical protein
MRPGHADPCFQSFPDRGEKKTLSPHRQKSKSGDTAVSEVSYACGAFLETACRRLGKKEFEHFRPPGASAGVLIGGGSQKDPHPILAERTTGEPGDDGRSGPQGPRESAKDWTARLEAKGPRRGERANGAGARPMAERR